MKFKILLAIASVLTAFIFLELMLRVYDSFMKDQYNNTEPVYSVLGEDGSHLLISNFDDYIYSNEAGKKVRFKTNKKGFLGEDFDLVTESGVIRIALVGDSYTQGGPFVDYTKTFSYLLQEKFNHDSLGSTEYEIMNFGIGGQSTVDESFYYDKYVKKYKPDIVLLVTFLGNDFGDNLRYIDRMDEIIGTKDLSSIDFKKAPEVANQPEVKNKEDVPRRILNLFLKSRLFHFFYQAFLIKNDWLFSVKWFVRAKLLGEPFKPDPNVFINIWPYTDLKDSVYGRQKEAIDFTVEVIKDLEHKVISNGSKFGFVIIPSPWQVDKKLTRRLTFFNPEIDLFSPNKIIMERLRDEFPILDLSQSISTAINEHNKTIYIRNVWHFTEDGNSLAANELNLFIKDNFLFKNVQ